MISSSPSSEAWNCFRHFCLWCTRSLCSTFNNDANPFLNPASLVSYPSAFTCSLPNVRNSFEKPGGTMWFWYSGANRNRFCREATAFFLVSVRFSASYYESYTWRWTILEYCLCKDKRPLEMLTLDRYIFINKLLSVGNVLFAKG